MNWVAVACHVLPLGRVKVLYPGRPIPLSGWSGDVYGQYSTLKRARKYAKYTLRPTLTICQAGKVVFRNEMNTISPEEVTMNSFYTGNNGMPGMVLVAALEYLHVMWIKAFEKRTANPTRPAAQKAARQQSAACQLECSQNSYAN